MDPIVCIGVLLQVEDHVHWCSKGIADTTKRLQCEERIQHLLKTRQVILDELHASSCRADPARRLSLSICYTCRFSVQPPCCTCGAGVAITESLIPGERLSRDLGIMAVAICGVSEYTAWSKSRAAGLMFTLEKLARHNSRRPL